MLHCEGRGVIERLTAPVQILLRDLLRLPALSNVNNMQLERGLRVADCWYLRPRKVRSGLLLVTGALRTG